MHVNFVSDFIKLLMDCEGACKIVGSADSTDSIKFVIEGSIVPNCEKCICIVFLNVTETSFSRTFSFEELKFYVK